LTYNTVAHIYDSHWRGTLRVMSRTISTAMDHWLLPAGTSLQFDADSYVQPSPLERAQTYEILLRTGVITVDEVREREHFGPLNLPAAPIPETVEVPADV
jgi:phage portal protein BeeE